MVIPSRALKKEGVETTRVRARAPGTQQGDDIVQATRKLVGTCNQEVGGSMPSRPAFSNYLLIPSMLINNTGGSNEKRKRTKRSYESSH
jgi:hypothetical protein